MLSSAPKSPDSEKYSKKCDVIAEIPMRGKRIAECFCGARDFTLEYTVIENEISKFIKHLSGLASPANCSRVRLRKTF